LILELEAAGDPNDHQQFASYSLSCLRRISAVSDEDGGLGSVLDEVARCIRELTGYDRVMVYQMDHLGHGAVASEDKAEWLGSFRGMHFPASDIPKQARELYLRNRVRLLSDIVYTKVDILRRSSLSDTPPLDMSLCHLRSVSPIHVEYLQNMGVSATMVISIVIDGGLWGMIACHHYSFKHIDAHVRNQCEKLAHVISFAIRAEEQRLLRRAADSSQTLLAMLDQAVGRDVDWLRRFLECEAYLLDQMDASGAVICDENGQYGIGMVPYSGLVEKIRRTLADKSNQDLVDVESLSLEDPAFANLGSDFCGCLMTTLSRHPQSQILWFRKELRRAIDWSGNPEKQVTVDDSGTRLSPRKSFAKWCEEVKGCSKPWTMQDRYRARAISHYVGSRKIEDASRQKSQFLKNISHEIRTPMTAIMGYVDVLAGMEAGTYQTVSDGALSTGEAISGIQKNGEQLLQIISGILDLSKLEAGELLVDVKPCSPRDLVGSVFAQMRTAAEKKGLSFTLRAPHPLPCQIHSDRERLHQVLVNLVDNAIKFTQRGSVAIEVVFDGGMPGTLEFLVRDTGTGINPNQVKYLFRPFRQGDASLTRKHGGTGLGLIVSRQLCRLLGGDLLIRESYPGVGSIFCMRIPTGLERVTDVEDLLETSLAPQKATQNLARPLPLLDRRILLVEDGVDNQRLISMFLRKAGAVVSVVENGNLAIESVAKAFRTHENYHVVVMDMQMPVLDGYSAARQLRSLGYTLPIIALTAHAMTGDRNKCIAAGCDEYLSKPVQKDMLIEAIERLTDNQKVVRAGEMTNLATSWQLLSEGNVIN
jgi:two-component system, chemotaxis family, sensor kinase Cph1